jgi:hypothetical protein
VRGLTATENLLVIQAPPWIGMTLIAVGVALVIGAFAFKPPRPSRLLASLGCMALLYAGWHLLNTKTTFESRGFIVDGMLGEQERVGWLQVASIETGAPAGARNFEPAQLTFQLRNSSEVAVDLTGLDAAEKARVLEFARARLKR